VTGYLYSKDHEWLKVDGRTGLIGITDYAQSELGDIVYVDLPKVQTLIEKSKSICTIEAVKTVADVYAPVSGKIIAVNTQINSSPELINKNPYDQGWIAKVELSPQADLSELLSATAYEKFLGEIKASH